MASYSDSEMRAIMGRALQIDSGRSERFTPEQLRTIAAELGISTQALEVAMYEADAKSRGEIIDARPARSGMSGFAKGLIAAAGAVAIIVAALAFMRTVGPGAVQRPMPVVEQPVPAVEQPLPSGAVEAQPEHNTAKAIPKKTTTKKAPQR